MNIGIINLNTVSRKLAWTNGLIAIVEARDDLKTREYSVAAHEWK